MEKSSIIALLFNGIQTGYITVTVPFNPPKLTGNYMHHFDYNNIWILSTHAYVGSIWFYKPTKNTFLYLNNEFDFVMLMENVLCEIKSEWFWIRRISFFIPGIYRHPSSQRSVCVGFMGDNWAREKIILLESLSFSVSIIPRILCVHLHFLATFRNASGIILRTFYESDIISKNTPPPLFFWEAVNFNSGSASHFVYLNSHLDC